jgi:hypothetical protein
MPIPITATPPATTPMNHARDRLGESSPVAVTVALLPSALQVALFPSVLPPESACVALPGKFTVMVASLKSPFGDAEKVKLPSSSSWLSDQTTIEVSSGERSVADTLHADSPS